MFHLRHPSIRVLAGAACLVLAGCGENKPSVSTSRQEVTVSGTVKIHGQLASEGEISFDPSNYLRNEAPRSAPIGKDGRFTISTLVGQNTVRVMSTQASPPPAIEEEGNREAVDRDSNVGYLEVQVEVKPAQDSLNIELPAPSESQRQ